MHYGAIFIETIFGFIMLFVLTKILGKTQIKQLTAFDFISALILGGELVGNALYDDQVGIREIGFAILVWGDFALYHRNYYTKIQEIEIDFRRASFHRYS
ncbi:membrane protein YetF [Gracilibacillus boraciitolerans JCM 21714]|uniref:Membrane protein YetF n=1 Tax=Gracilibacillus boraciitolerans JCM 21714 TaxID=1298598 RepID=W4VN54_9BACI|nr:membrane protein YetF [Gracilibacillus boraciitolerans JCM 21714]